MSYEDWAKDPEILRGVLNLYVDRGLNFGSIAEELHVPSRFVDPLLRRAIKDLERTKRDASAEAVTEKSGIERAILKRYPHLKDVFVVPGAEIKARYEYDALIHRWAVMVSRYLDVQAEDRAAAGQELHICMSGGETILEIVNRLDIKLRENVFYYASALIGRAHTIETTHVDPVTNATIAWSRSGRVRGRCVYATVTPYDRSTGGRNFMERRESVTYEVDETLQLPLIRRYLMDLSDTVSIAVAGLGAIVEPVDDKIGPLRFTSTNLLQSMTHITGKDLLGEGAVGEIGYCYYDQNGTDPDGKWRFYITAGDHDPALRGVRFYRNMVERGKQVIVVAGAFKEPNIIPALRGQLFNVWFTNEAAARTVLANSQ